jgi:hypothetical protein
VPVSAIVFPEDFVASIFNAPVAERTLDGEIVMFPFSESRVIDPKELEISTP